MPKVRSKRNSRRKSKSKSKSKNKLSRKFMKGGSSKKSKKTLEKIWCKICKLEITTQQREGKDKKYWAWVDYVTGKYSHFICQFPNQ